MDLRALHIRYSPTTKTFLFLFLYLALAAWHGPLYTLPIFRILALYGMLCMDFSLAVCWQVGLDIPSVS